MSKEKVVAAELIGQQAFRSDYDCGVLTSDIEERVKVGNRHLTAWGKVIDGRFGISTFRIDSCLVDNCLTLPIFEGIMQAFLIVGPIETAVELRDLLDYELPRRFATLSSYRENIGAINRSRRFRVEMGFDANLFSSAEAALRYLLKGKLL